MSLIHDCDVKLNHIAIMQYAGTSQSASVMCVLSADNEWINRNRKENVVIGNHVSAPGP